MHDIKGSIDQVREKISHACQISGRSVDDVKLMAVSKFHPVEEIRTALECGITLFGENHVQEAISKFPVAFEGYSNCQVQMIGSLQRNKVKSIVTIASCIQSVDRIELIDEIEKQASKIDKTIRILFELHTGEESKSGFPDKDSLQKAVELTANKTKYPHIIPSGFMTMAPFTDNIKQIRHSFITLRETSLKIQKEFPELNMTELSMGMSSDYEIAIEEGSTLVRVGTAIFGKRNYGESTGTK